MKYQSGVRQGLGRNETLLLIKVLQFVVFRVK